VDLKVHSKMTLIVRREEDETVLYTHVGTGNYHPGSAKVYTDLAYFSCNETLGNDVNKVFNYLTSGSIPSCSLLSVAPGNLRKDLLMHIDTEIENAEQGKTAEIWAKLNALTDPELIDKLYSASQAGVNIELIVRRQCRLKPGVEGLSENIRVKSIVGRYLEHSRIYCFANGNALPHPKAKVFLSSADWMERNFDDRVEIMIPVTDPIVHQQVLDDVLCKNIEDTDQSWILTPSGEYQRQVAGKLSVQEWFMNSETRSGKS
jgi:polyphosphate kinase